MYPEVCCCCCWCFTCFQDNVFEKLATVTSVLTPTSSVGKKLTDPCIECCQESSTVSCDVCDAVYCDACFDTVSTRIYLLSVVFSVRISVGKTLLPVGVYWAMFSHY